MIAAKDTITRSCKWQLFKNKFEHLIVRVINTNYSSLYTQGTENKLIKWIQSFSNILYTYSKEYKTETHSAVTIFIYHTEEI